MDLASQIEQYVSLGIMLVGFALATVSYLAWRRERERRMAIVTISFGLFALYGLIVFLEYFLLSYVSYSTVELLEHSAAIFILVGLLGFFVAVVRE
ncbi:MAG: hypothetical protein ACOCQ7_02445 [Natronomonas sp.]